MFKFDNPDEVTKFKFAYEARNANGEFNDRPTEIDIYGGTPNGDNYTWTKIKTEKASGNINTHGVKGIGGISGVLDIDTQKPYSALKFVVNKTNTNKKFFTYGEIALYSEVVFPAGTTAATEEQVTALNKALAGLDQELRPYQGNPETIEKAAREAINGIVKDIKKHRAFKELSSAEQTILFSRHYQDGNIKDITPSREIAKSLAQGLVQDALDKLNTKYYRDDSHKNRIPLEHADLQAWFNTINAEEYKVKQDDEKTAPASADQPPAQPQTPAPSAHPNRRHRK